MAFLAFPRRFDDELVVIVNFVEVLLGGFQNVLLIVEDGLLVNPRRASEL